ncbi:putative EH domain-containing protein 1-like protein isoform X1 [Tanacetum coccineum]
MVMMTVVVWWVAAVGEREGKNGAWPRVVVGIEYIGLRRSFLGLAGKTRRKSFPAAAGGGRRRHEFAGNNGGERGESESDVYVLCRYGTKSLGLGIAFLSMTMRRTLWFGSGDTFRPNGERYEGVEIISVSLLDELMILLRNATRITHKALGVTCLVDSFDAPDLETDTPPTSAMGNQVFHHDALSDNEDVGSEDVLDNTKLIPAYASSTIPFHKRQALGLHNHSDDRDVIGVMVLWLLGKTVGIS